MVVSLSRLAGSLFVLIGTVWSLQGVGVIGGSFMTGSMTWLVIGVLTIIVGFVLLVLWLPPRFRLQKGRLRRR